MRRCTNSTKRWRTQTPEFTSSGRLATYKYYNMDQVVAQALTLCGKLSATSPGLRHRQRARLGDSGLTTGDQTSNELICRMTAGSNFIRRSYVIRPLISCSTS